MDIIEMFAYREGKQEATALQSQSCRLKQPLGQNFKLFADQGQHAAEAAR